MILPLQPQPNNQLVATVTWQISEILPPSTWERNCRRRHRQDAARRTRHDPARRVRDAYGPQGVCRLSSPPPPDILQHNGLEKVILFRCVTAPREACAVPLELFIRRFRNKPGQDQRNSGSTWQVDEMSTRIRRQPWSAEQWAWQIC
jgi:hypothetical protein